MTRDTGELAALPVLPAEPLGHQVGAESRRELLSVADAVDATKTVESLLFRTSIRRGGSVPVQPAPKFQQEPLSQTAALQLVESSSDLETDGDPASQSVVHRAPVGGHMPQPRQYELS